MLPRPIDSNHFNTSIKTTVSLYDSIQQCLKAKRNIIKSVTLIRGPYSRLEITNALKECKHLTSLTFNDATLGESSDPVEEVELNKLRELIVSEGSSNVLAIVSTESLKSFSYHSWKADVALALDFLSRQKTLERLEIFTNTFFLNDVMLGFPFKLKCLEICRADLAKVSSQFISYLKLHLGSLEKLSLRSQLNEEILGFIFRSANKIQILKIDVKELPSIEEAWFWDDIESMESVQELKVCGKFLNADVARKFLALFPMLKKLEVLFLHALCISSDGNEDLSQALPALLPHLEHLIFLKLVYYDISFAHNLRIFFPHLKKLSGHIDSEIFCFNLFIQFIDDHRMSLEEISVVQPSVRCYDLEIFTAISECPNLKILCFEEISRFSYSDFVRLLDRKAAWTLKFKHLSKEDIYHFPDDKQIFKRLFDSKSELQ